MSKKISLALIAALTSTPALGGNAQAAPRPPASTTAITALSKVVAPATTKPLAPIVRSVAPGSEKLPLLDLKVDEKRFNALSNGALKPDQPVSRYPVVLNFPVEGITNVIPLATKGSPVSECGCKAPDEVVMVQNPADKPPGATATERAAWQLARAMQRVSACLGQTTALNPRDRLPLWISTNSMMPTTNGMGGTGCVKLAHVLSALVPSSAVVDNDTDGDNIVDRLDKCPNQPGPKENEGCPVKTVAAEPAPPAAATVPVVAPEAPKAPVVAVKDNSLFGYLRIAALLDLTYLAPIGSSDYFSPLSRGLTVGPRVAVELDRINMSRWGVRLDVSGSFHPYVYGQANLVSTESATIQFGLVGMYHLSRNVNLNFGLGLVDTQLVASGSRQLICGLGKLGIRYTPTKSGIYWDLGIGAGGGSNTERGYAERKVALVEAGTAIGYAWPVKLGF